MHNWRLFSFLMGHRGPWATLSPRRGGNHYSDVIMGAIASQITSLTIVYSAIYSGADQRNHQSSASLPLCGIHRSPVNSPYKWPVTRKMFPFDDVIMNNNSQERAWWSPSFLVTMVPSTPVYRTRYTQCQPMESFQQKHSTKLCIKSMGAVINFGENTKWIDMLNSKLRVIRCVQQSHLKSK